jgi:hypothetical protein
MDLNDATINDVLTEFERRGYSAAVVTVPMADRDTFADALKRGSVAEAPYLNSADGSNIRTEVHVTHDMRHECSVPAAFLLSGIAVVLTTMPFAGPATPAKEKAWQSLRELLTKCGREISNLTETRDD